MINSDRSAKLQENHSYQHFLKKKCVCARVYEREKVSVCLCVCVCVSVSILASKAVSLIQGFMSAEFEIQHRSIAGEAEGREVEREGRRENMQALPFSVGQCPGRAAGPWGR